MKRLGALGAVLALAMFGGFVGCDTDDDEEEGRGGRGGIGGFGGLGGFGGIGGIGGEAGGLGGAGGAGGSGGAGGAGGTGGVGGTGGTGGIGGGDVVLEDIPLNGNNEFTSVATDATGKASAVLNGDTLTVVGDFQNLGSPLFPVSGSAAHVHSAMIDASGPIIFPLDVVSSNQRSGTFSGSKELSPDEKTQFGEGLFYVNVHSELYPNGEIRGHFADRQRAPADQLYQLELSGANEVPPVTTSATGVISVSLRGSGNRMELNCSFTGLSSDLELVSGSPAHVHRAPPGEAGPIQFNVQVVPNSDNRSGTCMVVRDLNAVQLEAYDAGELYFNIHTEDHPTGELRVQLVPPG